MLLDVDAAKASVMHLDSGCLSRVSGEMGASEGIDEYDGDSRIMEKGYCEGVVCNHVLELPRGGPEGGVVGMSAFVATV